MRPHRRQPTRLPRPWDSPGKNTGAGCHFLLQCMKVKSESEVAQSCPTLSDPMDCSLPGSSIHGIFQARVLEWGATAFSVSSSLLPLKLSFSLVASFPHSYKYTGFMVLLFQTAFYLRPLFSPFFYSSCLLQKLQAGSFGGKTDKPLARLIEREKKGGLPWWLRQ